jgi:hypothetical protein
MSLRRAVMLVTGVAAASSGAYMLIYLYRWQWNRALIAAIFFVAAEVALVAELLLERLRRVERALEAPAPVVVVPVASPEEFAVARSRLREAAPPATRHFAWLRDSATQHNVFLPVLLGAGVIASAVAWLVEAVARRTVHPVLDRPAAAGLARLAFPPDGLLGEPGPVPAPRKPRRWLLVLAAVAVTIGMGLTIDVLADATQTRPDDLAEGVVTVIDVELFGARAGEDVERHAEDLYGICESDNFATSLSDPLIVQVGERHVRYVVHDDLGERGSMRFRGCLEDTMLEGVQARAIRYERLQIGG